MAHRAGRSTSGTQFAEAESRILGLGRTPLAGVEATIYENGPGVVGGPSAVSPAASWAPAETPGTGARSGPPGAASVSAV